MKAGLLILNAGSSSLKFALYELSKGDALELSYRGALDGIGGRTRLKVRTAGGESLEQRELALGTNHEQALAAVLDWVEANLNGVELAAAGHRVVHGGPAHAEPALVDAELMSELKSLCPLAPLHQPHNLAAIRAIQALRPELPQVACFDTAFHRSQPMLAQRFALPEEYARRGILRYGFHGLSYEYIARQLPDYDAGAAAGRTIVAHLGNGASMCAMQAGSSVATTMGFTALDGLMMGQRGGSIDPGVLLYLLQHDGLSVEQLEQLLYHRSGLLGVSGFSMDMRELLATELPAAKFSVDLYCYRARLELGSLVAALGGLDALVFTGGIGENAAPVREAICRELGWLGLDFDTASNAINEPRISHADSRVRAWVIPTDEEQMIAQHTLSFLQGGSTVLACSVSERDRR